MSVKNDPPPEILKMFLEEVREEMKNVGMTQTVMSEKSGLSNAGLSKYFRFRATPRVSTLEKMAKALNMKVVVCLMEDE